MLPTRDSFRTKDTCRLKVRGWRNIYQPNIRQKKARVAIFVSDEVDFKAMTITKRQRKTLYDYKGNQSDKKI